MFASDEEFFGNGTQSYLEAFNKKGRIIKYETARANASRLLTNAIVLERINELMEEAILNDTFVDKQLGFLISQNADFRAKVSAIKEYNALKKRITQKIDLTSKGEKITGFNYLMPKDDADNQTAT